MQCRCRTASSKCSAGALQPVPHAVHVHYSPCNMQWRLHKADATCSAGALQPVPHAVQVHRADVCTTCSAGSHAVLTTRWPCANLTSKEGRGSQPQLGTCFLVGADHRTVPGEDYLEVPLNGTWWKRRLSWGTTSQQDEVNWLCYSVLCLCRVYAAQTAELHRYMPNIIGPLFHHAVTRADSSSNSCRNFDHYSMIRWSNSIVFKRRLIQTHFNSASIYFYVCITVWGSVFL